MSGRRGGPQIIPRPVETRSGPPAPWSGLDPSDRQVTLTDLRRRLAARRPRAPVEEPFPVRRPAGVLIPIYPAADGLRLVLTRRPTAMRSHSGEVSFPGGGYEPADADIVHTALREAEEEIGLPARCVEVIGRLDPLATMSSGAMITPIVGSIAAMPPLRAEPGEVAAILHVPLHELLDDEVFRHEWWPMPPHVRALGSERWRPMYYYDLHGDTIWGATARMLTQLLRIATGTEEV